MTVVETSKIDIVIPWVDGEDPIWKKKKEKYTSKNEPKAEESYDGPMRYRDYGTLKYLLRSIAQNASWVNRVFLVTDNQVPEWLNTRCPQLKVVDHTDFIPERYLPTFNTNAIELNVHRIKDLSEHFILLNDDMLFNDVTQREDFFVQGMPVDNMILSVIPSQNDFSHILLNNMLIINKYFDKNDVIKNNWKKLFSFRNKAYMVRTMLSIPWTGINGFYNPHQGIPYTKSSFKRIWSMEESMLDSTCLHKSRSSEDVSDWVIRYYQLCSGKFVTGNPSNSQYYDLNQIDELKKELTTKKRHKFICINDVDDEKSFDQQNSVMLNNFLEARFPTKSKFELL